MRILLTGASSFTGYWFAKELAGRGHHVTATFTRQEQEAYSDGVRAQRVAELQSIVSPAFGVSFGDERFLSLLRDPGFDALCVHGADVTDYKSPDFNVAKAIENNTRSVAEVVRAVAEQDARIVLTGSVFEGGEGAGSDGLPHFSPYGLSKALTCEAFRFYAQQAGVVLGKFVIPNPFGPFEEPRFTSYLIRTWKAGDAAGVRTPLYVRDNIHVSLLAKAYERFVCDPDAPQVNGAFHPSGYVESQGAFAARFAAEMRPRLGLECAVECANQTECAEPRMRVNTDPLGSTEYGWDEKQAWDEIAEFYQQTDSTTG